MPAVRAHVLDATGAGDSFKAGFLACYLRGASLVDCAKAGVFASARPVSLVGRRAALE
ncbi:MAG: PfkB family carbohydrate kinase [Bryobacteraceae bacterium]